jgi:hypothetical protein|tara:strand:- start:6620 stop:7189 length:570 start_codon:yes stop_codon:yes gene_type:complete
MKRIVVTGTGRAGTSLLMQLFTHLGMPTGFTQEDIEKIQKRKCRAGLERQSFKKNVEIIKHPILTDQVSKMERLDHVIIPIRNLIDSAKSRVKQGINREGEPIVHGGVWQGATDHSSQVKYNAELIYTLMYDLSDSNIPFTFIQFPKFSQDPGYLWSKLDWLFDEYSIKKNKFNESHKLVVKEEFISKF